MKIAVTGKGGVGKTTICATLCHAYSIAGKKVLAVDADPDANLAAAFGLSREESLKILPIAEMADLIEERTGAQPGQPGGVYNINPRVDDIPDEFGYRFDSVTLIATGRSKEAASGCFCPENVLLRRLLKHIIVERDEVVVVDMEAGIEHLTRGTASAVDAFIVVVEPGQRSIQTAHTVKEMALGLGIKKVYVVANKVRNASDVEFIRSHIPGITLAGTLGFSHDIMEADIKGLPPYEVAPSLLREIIKIKETIEGDIAD